MLALDGLRKSAGKALAQPPGWVGYIVAPVLQAVLTAAVLQMDPWLPVSSFPFAHIIGVMVVAYFFGEGPGVLSFFAGLVLFSYSSTYPTPFVWNEPRAWQLAGVAAYAMGAAIGGLLSAILRRFQLRVRGLLQELRREQALLDTYSQNVPVGLALHDQESRYVIVNQSLAGFLGLRREDMLGKTVWDSLPEVFAREVVAAIGSVFLTGSSVIWPEVSINLDRERHFHIEFHPVRTSDGRMLGVGLVMVDVTSQVEDRKNLERIYEHERHIAETLQSSLVGVPPPHIGPFRFESFYRAAMEEARLGGDFHDVFLMGGDKVGIVIGDVSGKGLAAAVQVAMVKYTLRSRAYESSSPGRVMQHANVVATRSGDGDGFISVFFGVLDCSRRTLTYACAGHSPTMLWRSAERRTHILNHTGYVLGIREDAAYGEESLYLDPGDEILLGTDGLYEIKCGDSFLEIDGLVDLYANLRQSGPITAEAFVDKVRDYCGNPLRDDVAILRVEVADAAE